MTRSPEQILRDAKTIAVVGASPRPDRPELTPEVAREAVAIGAGGLWLQLGIASAEARAVAEAGGLDCVEDACTMVVHRDLS